MSNVVFINCVTDNKIKDNSITFLLLFNSLIKFSYVKCKLYSNNILIPQIGLYFKDSVTILEYSEIFLICCFAVKIL